MEVSDSSSTIEQTSELGSWYGRVWTTELAYKAQAQAPKRSREGARSLPAKFSKYEKKITPLGKRHIFYYAAADRFISSKWIIISLDSEII